MGGDMKTVLLLSFALLLAGCVTAHPTYLPDGSMGHSISCGGTAQTMASCYEKAGEICGASGFTVIDQHASSAPFAQSQGAFKADQKNAIGGYTSTSGAIIQRNLFIKCNK